MVVMSCCCFLPMLAEFDSSDLCILLVVIFANVGKIGFCFYLCYLLFCCCFSFLPTRRLKKDHGFNKENFNEVFGNIPMGQLGEIFLLIEAGTGFMGHITLMRLKAGY